MQRDDIASTLKWHCIDVLCLPSLYPVMEASDIKQVWIEKEKKNRYLSHEIDSVISCNRCYYNSNAHVHVVLVYCHVADPLLWMILSYYCYYKIVITTHFQSMRITSLIPLIYVLKKGCCFFFPKKLLFSIFQVMCTKRFIFFSKSFTI